MLYTMTAGDIPRLITNALANGLNQTKPEKDDLTMSMNQPTNQYAGNMNQVQKTPLTFTVYDPSTGRNWVENNAGRRIVPTKEMTGSQLVGIQSMRNQLNLKMLNDHNVKSMSIDSASVMMDDLRYFIDLIRNMQMQHEHQVQVLTDELDRCLKSPEVGAQLVKMQQAERAKNEK